MIPPLGDIRMTRWQSGSPGTRPIDAIDTPPRQREDAP
jgi:hypothetical protein